MTLRFRMLEPDAQPNRVEFAVEVGDDVRLYALDPELSWAGLRNTVARRGSALPPPGSTFVGVATVREDHLGRPALRLSALGADVEMERVLEHGRTGLTAPEDLASDEWLSLTLPDLRRVRLALRLEQPTVQGAAATVGGSGTKRSQIVRGETGLLWLVPTIWTIYTDQQQYVMNNIRAVGKRLGLGPRSIQGLFIFAAFASATGYALYLQYNARADAEDAAAAAEDDATRADEARQAALRAEMTCLAERRELAQQLGLETEARKIRAEASLGLAAARALARDLGGSRFGAPELVDADIAVGQALHEAVAWRMADIDQSVESARSCLDEAVSLGDDLPRYALLWHPDPDAFCPADYAGVADGITQVGRWGLSPRIADRYGLPLPLEGPKTGAAELSDDPRLNDRWSANTLTTALREAQLVLLTGGDSRRAPVWPSEAQLWSLALLDATNRMPRTADGALDEPHTTCIDGLMRAVSDQRPALPPGEPTLPSLVEVADGTISLRAPATPGCPWPADAFAHGAEAALQAAARLAAVSEVESP